MEKKTTVNVFKFDSTTAPLQHLLHAARHKNMHIVNISQQWMNERQGMSVSQGT